MQSSPLIDDIRKVGSENMEQILIVEDDTDINNMVASALTKAGYECKQSFSGTEAMLYLNKEKFSVIILDLMLPGKSGNSIVEEIKPYLDTSIIVVSAKDELDTKVNLLFSGADDYITKPFSSGYLRARISSLLKQREMLHDYFMKQAFRSFEQENLVASSVSLDSFSPSIPQITSFDEVFIQRVIQVVESKLQEQDFKIEDLADTMKMGRTVFYRKVKSILGVTPIDLVKDMRVKRAIQLLDSGNYNISQVAYMSGFSSPQYFSRVFKELKNCTPSEYKTKAFD